MRFQTLKSGKMQKIAYFCGIGRRYLPFVKAFNSTMNGKGILSDSTLSGDLRRRRAYG